MSLPNNLKKLLKKILLIKLNPKDTELVKSLKEKFAHEPRTLSHGLWKFSVDSLNCEAAPGVMETTVTFLEKHLENQLSQNHLLNLGGGLGQTSEIYKFLGFDVFNLDINLTQEKIDSQNLFWDLNSLKQLPVAKGAFDLAICQEVIEHIENPWKLFRDASFGLKNGGILLLSTPNVCSVISRLIFLFSGYFHWFLPSTSEYHINALPWWELKLIAAKTGFELIDFKGNGNYYFNRENRNRSKIIRHNENIVLFFKKIKDL